MQLAEANAPLSIIDFTSTHFCNRFTLQIRKICSLTANSKLISIDLTMEKKQNEGYGGENLHFDEVLLDFAGSLGKFKTILSIF